jgi:glycerophosphoryl diester phosphodiesterase
MVKPGLAFERVGHRGAPRVFPANTLRSFQAARAMGCTMVECDVRLSRDGSLVLAHDPAIRNAFGEERVVSECSQAELAAFDLGTGEGPATLEQLVAWARMTGMHPMVDMKCEGGPETGPVEKRIADLLSDVARECKCVSGAGPASRRRFREADTDLPLLLSMSRGDALPNIDDTLNQIFTSWPEQDVDGVSWEHPLITAERVAILHGKGARVFAWTVDDLETMRRLLACGIDGITSNRSDLFAALE